LGDQQGRIDASKCFAHTLLVPHVPDEWSGAHVDKWFQPISIATKNPNLMALGKKLFRYPFADLARCACDQIVTIVRHNSFLCFVKF
jgi:hypothetical protein